MSSHLNVPSSGKTRAPAAPPHTGPLPRDYGVTRLVLLPRDPRWMHAYWEVADYTWSEVRRHFGDALRQGRPVLRVHSNHGGRTDIFDVDVQLEARSWYVFSPREDGHWHAELGLLLPDGRFVLLALSNTIRLPAGQVSDVLDERWGVFKTEWERIFELSGGGRRSAGSVDLTRLGAQRMEGLQSLSSWSGLPGSPTGGFGPPPRPKGFWLIANCEVLVYGATEPDAVVTFRDRVIPLNADGTFSFRFPLPNGTQTFPIRSVNADGDLSRFIEFRVSRRTRQSRD